MPKMVKIPDRIGIKCDAIGCGWSDPSIMRADMESWRNAACPWCGENVLTDADWLTYTRMQKTFVWVNRLFGWTLWFDPNYWRGNAYTTYRVGGDGSGKLTIKRVSD
jgi:hypothetical protein